MPARALEADIAIRYQVGAASWVPFYDARLATGTKAQAPKLQLVRRASIQQRSGESWDNVALALSTAAVGRYRRRRAAAGHGRLQAGAAAGAGRRRRAGTTSAVGTQCGENGSCR